MKTSVDNDCQFKLDAFRCTQPVKTGKSVSDVVDVNSLLWEIPRLAEISSLFGSMQLHSQFRGGHGAKLERATKAANECKAFCVHIFTVKIRPIRKSEPKPVSR